jgi:ADP-ribose pyrophosphatase YjhB (NUDIX family)
MNFCNLCGLSLSLKVPEGDDRQRHICESCGHIHYQNPRIIVCTIPCYEDKVLLCKRAIEPRYGLWTVPGGFMENAETTQEGALRETWEEAHATVKLLDIYSLYNLPHINQVHLFFRASLLNLDFSAGIESLEVELFRQEEIPWDEIAFPPVSDTLKNYFIDKETDNFPMRCANIRVNENDERVIENINREY